MVGDLDAPVDEADALARASWLAMYKLFRSDETREAAMATADELELTDQQLGALLGVPLEDDGGISMRELADHCRTSASYLTSVVDTLETRGFVRRHPDPDDRRVTRLRLTLDGKAAVYRAHFRLGTPPAGLRDLPLQDLRTLAGILARAAEGYPGP